MNYLYSILFVCAVLNGFQCAVLNDIGRWNSALYKDVVKNCIQDGLMCKTCKQVALCISNGEGGFNQIDTERCDSKELPNCNNGKCAADPSPNCVEEIIIAFPCTSKGVFPDPFNCKKYHICCGTETSNVNNCDKEHGYDPATTYCKNALKNETCTDVNVPKCNKAGDLGPLVKNKSIYYICQKKTTEAGESVLYPVQYLCPNGKTFVDNQCKL